MAVLSDIDRTAVSAEIQRQLSDAHESCGVTKAQLRAAIDALDDFLEANAAALNSAIPQPARGALTTAQKARLLAYVALRRWGS